MKIMEKLLNDNGVFTGNSGIFTNGREIANGKLKPADDTLKKQKIQKTKSLTKSKFDQEVNKKAK